MNPMMPDYSSDNTKAAIIGGSPPYGFIPHMDEAQIHEIVKGCFISGKQCLDHFRMFGNNESLTMNDFVTAVGQLGCSWPATTSQ